jgi:SAM-dependent methyltransferase
MNCRHCDAKLSHLFLDLGFAPPSNAYLSAADMAKPEQYLPLRLFVCDRCWLVQTDDCTHAAELFRDDYAYFSSTSAGWVAHARRYAEAMTERLKLTADSHVIEVASNDGYLLKNFVQAKIPCLGIEPTASTAAAAERLGIPVLREFFGEALAMGLAKKGKSADLIAGNNVYAHVPDINDFTRGLAAVLKPAGTITLEFPHLLQLIEKIQFDTVYHEHFSYLSLHTVCRIFERAGLRVWDVDEIPTHGGSLRVFGCHAGDARTASPRVAEIIEREQRAGLRSLDVYREFQAKANRVKDDFVSFLIEQKRAGKRVAGYGAAAKGNTLLNYAGIKPDLLPFVCDAAASKQGKFMPGSHIPILDPEAIRQHRPDLVVILPWNLNAEVRQSLQYISEWGGRFVTAVPELAVA